MGISTATAGAVNGNASIAFVSDANNVGNCAPNCQLNLAAQNVAVSGAIYRLANPQITTARSRWPRAWAMRCPSPASA